MSEKKSEALYEGITNISDEIVIEAESAKPEKKRPAWLKWSALAACLCVLFAGVYGAARLGIIDRFGGAESGGSGGSGATYMSYAGPVFPLTTLGDASGLTAEREIDFDFSPYETYERSYESGGETHTYELYDSESAVTDSYTLTNTTGADITVAAAYPFAASFRGDASLIPEISVGGETVTAQLYAGPYSGGFQGAWGTDDPENPGSLNLAQLDSWEGYKALIEAGYIDRAFDEWPKLSQRVTVYELSNRRVADDVDASNPTLNMEFFIDYDKTTILTYGFNGGTVDVESGYCARNTHVPKSVNPDYGQSAYIVVIGDDIGEYTLLGYADGGCDEGEEIDGVTANVRRYESTLGETLESIARLYFDLYHHIQPGEEGGDISGVISRETYLGAAAELMYDYGALSGSAAQRYDFGMMEDILSETGSVQRIMYLTFEITVPAGGSVAVTASMTKKASIDFVGKNKGRDGYDMVTRLGSSLAFTAQRASISGMEHVEIVSQNFGFDPAAGVTSVALSPAEEHYFIEVRKKDPSSGEQ